jgi:hypothetical protein
MGLINIISSAIIAIAGSFGARLLVGLGITLGSYAGLDSIVNTAIGYIQTNYGGITPNVLAIFNMAGFGQAFGIILGAYLTKAAMKSISVFAGSLS